MDLNKFAALSDKEMDSYTGINITDIQKLETLSKRLIPLSSSSIPHLIYNRLTLGLSAPRFDPKRKAGGWAYSVGAAFEGQYKILTDEILQLSEYLSSSCLIARTLGSTAAKVASWMLASDMSIQKRCYPTDGSTKAATAKELTLETLSPALEEYKLIPAGEEYKLIPAGEDYELRPAGDNSFMRAVVDIGPVSAAIYSPRSF